ncbi:hypothetical protein GGX14DRAFT_403418 [Mycena pura]|uniref:HECT domain-containing protein n=1 Tax=Mycena pura TaxID=153505 RepID=A0AAD6Y146_9AGAR|nr:hypothetical protein GGX14DRAFT_403418 [Mycena pura]
MSGSAQRVQPKRKHANTHPGDIVKNAAQHRRTQDEIEADKAKKQAAKETKVKRTQEKHDKQVKAAAAAEQMARERAASEKEKEARPDLVTAAAPKQRRASQPSEEARPEQMEDERPVADSDDSDPSGSYKASDMSDDDDQFDAKWEEMLKLKAERDAAKKAKKDKEQKSKPGKGKEKAPLRAEIQAKSTTSHTTKRKAEPAPASADDNSDSDGAPSSKKPKAAVGGVLSDWRKQNSVSKPPAKSSSSWARTVDRMSTSSASSALIHSEGDGVIERDDSDAEMLAQEVQATQRAKQGARTEQMGIKLVPKPKDADDAKPKRERQLKAKNSDLPFYGIDAAMKLFRRFVVDGTIDWSGTMRDSFNAPAHPKFRDIVKENYERAFGKGDDMEYELTEAVYAVVRAAVHTWRSELAKHAIILVDILLKQYEVEDGDGNVTIVKRTRDERIIYNRKLRRNGAFLYVQTEPTCSGSYRSDIMVKMLAKHFSYALASGFNYGFPSGAISVNTVAVERALELMANGDTAAEIDTDNARSKNRTAKFTGAQWGKKALGYWESIDALSDRKRAELLGLVDALGKKPESGADLIEEAEESEPDFRENILMSASEEEDDDQRPMISGS